MSYQSCRAIIPKFQWKHIIEYISYNNIVKMNLIDFSFNTLIDENTGRCNFLEHRTDAIVVVKCDTHYMDYFWKYALQNYISCGNINELFQYFEDDIKHNTTMIHYKVFIRIGVYPYDNYAYNNNGYAYRSYNFSENLCSIEINGSKSGSTTIIFTNDKIIDYYALSAVIPKYFSIKHIIFRNMSCTFVKHQYDAGKSNCLTDDKFVSTYADATLHINNCVFEGSHADLAIDSINKASIINCIFDARLHISNGISFGRSIESRMHKLGLTNNIECSISHSTFSIKSPKDGCIDIYSELPHSINFTNNLVLKAATLFYDGIFNKNTAFQVSNNTISNMDMCVQCCRDIKFVSNHFDGVMALYDDSSSNITIDDTNTFINCDEQLMNQIKIENISQ